MKVLFVIHHLIEGGASDAMVRLAECLEEYDVDIFTKKNERINTGFNIIEGTEKELGNLIVKNFYQVVHWFKTDYSNLFSNTITILKNNKAIQKLPPIILTHCQIPSNIYLSLTPIEIKYSNKIVFITNTAKKLCKHSLVENNKKKMVYFGAGGLSINQKTHNKNKTENIKFVRGSTLNKCPKEALRSFKQINSSTAKFYIAGSGNNNSLLKYAEELKISNKVEFLGHLNIYEWFKLLYNSDIYLYELPPSAYSAIDGTIQHAMLTGLPVIYKGPKAPAELIVHGITGYVAKNEKEICNYAQLLIENPSLRNKIGNAARKYIQQNFSLENTKNEYIKLYNEVINEPSKILSNTFNIQTLLYSWVYYIVYIFVKAKDSLRYRFKMLMGNSKN